MHHAIIYSPAKSSMQSGTAKTGHWVLEFKNIVPKTNNPLMGWSGGSETESQVSLKFETLDAAINYANTQEISFIVRKPKKRSLKIKSYSANYAFDSRETWTH